MRIGVMLRHLDQHGGGLLGYTRQVVRAMLRLDVDHEFVLMYRSRRFFGSFGGGERVREVAAAAPTRVAWDQLVVPRLARRARVDLLFNPKFSVPLVGGCPSVFVCHGLDWFVEPNWSNWQDRLSHRHLFTRYAKKASRIIAVSESTRSHVRQFLGVGPERVITVHHGFNRAFLETVDSATMEQVRSRFDLPQRFFLYCGQIYPPKNFGRLLRAYADVGPRLGIHLVVAGVHKELCESEIALIEPLGLSDWVRQVGWVDHRDLPVFYQSAVALVMPSLYESFLIPALEAMASGCPVVTADRFGPKEVAGDAAVLVNPEDVSAIARGMEAVSQDAVLRERLVAAGRERVRRFDWDKCARETIDVLEGASTAKAGQPSDAPV